MVKRDKLMEWYQLGKILIFYGVFVPILAIGLWVFKGQNPTALLIMAIIFLLLGVGILRWGRRWVKLELLRQVAASGEEEARNFLATEQPQPDVAALTLPCKIKLRPKWTPPILCFVVVGIITFTPLTILFLNTPPLPFWLYAIGYGEFLLFPILTSALFLLAGWQTIIVTDEGLKVRAEQFEKIKWEDARLFAIYPANKRSEPPIRYELSGPKTIVRWKRMQRGVSSLLTKTPAPFDEYDRQMEALLALIAAKTGLPLYDLREG